MISSQYKTNDKTNVLLKNCVLAAILAGSTSMAIASGPSTPTAAEQLAMDQQTTSVSNLDRYGTIAGIVATWDSEMGANEGWETEFTAALNAATDAQLLAIQDATSYSSIQATLQGRLTPVSMEGVTSPEALGNLNADLVFTPVVPCRIFDTRFDNVAGPGHTTGLTATTRSYQVHGTAAQLAHQGHNSGSTSGPGCPAPNGEPSGIHANFTAANQLGNGNIRAWPTGGTLPNVSLVNYTASTNIANAASVATGYLIGDDINITTQYGTSEQIGDVMGYYYPAIEESIGADFASGNQSVALTSTDVTVRSVTITAPKAGRVIVNASGYFDFNSTTLLDVARCSITTGTSIDFNHLILVGEQSVASVDYDSFAATRGYAVSAGNTTFRLVCDEFSGVVNVEDTSITAIFVPDAL